MRVRAKGGAILYRPVLAGVRSYNNEKRLPRQTMYLPINVEVSVPAVDL